MFTLKKAERLLLSCLDRPDAAAQLLPKMMQQIMLQLRLQKWNVTMLAKNGKITGGEARAMLEETAREIESVRHHELENAKQIMLQYLRTPRLTPDLLNMILEMQGEDNQDRSALELSSRMIFARDPKMLA